MKKEPLKHIAEMKKGLLKVIHTYMKKEGDLQIQYGFRKEGTLELKNGFKDALIDMMHIAKENGLSFDELLEGAVEGFAFEKGVEGRKIRAFYNIK
jgi:hypothetical protein